jgi:hypothetical protein
MAHSCEPDHDSATGETNPLVWETPIGTRQAPQENAARPSAILDAAAPLKKFAPALIATLLLGALLFAFLDLNPGEIGAAVLLRLGQLRPGMLLLAFGVYLCSYFGRAARLMVLLPGIRGLPHLASIAARHNLLNLVLPFRSGEVALPWMLKKEAGRPVYEGAAALVICRVLDLFSVAAYLCLGLAWYGLGSGASKAVAPQAAAVLAVLLLVLASLRPLARLGVRIVGPDAQGRVRSFLAGAAKNVGEQSSGRLAAAAAISLATWLLTYTTFFLLVTAMAGPDPVGQELSEIGFSRSLVGTTGLHLSTVLPVNAIGGLGSWELGWVAGYTALSGVTKETAAISAVVSHVAIFCFVMIIGGLGFLFRKSLRVSPDLNT